MDQRERVNRMLWPEKLFSISDRKKQSSSGVLLRGGGCWGKKLVPVSLVRLFIYIHCKFA